MAIASLSHERTAVDPRRLGYRIAGAVALLLLLLAGLIFSNSVAVRQAIDDGAVVYLAESVLGANDMAFKSTGQALLLAEDHQFGVADETTARLALSEANETTNHLALTVDQLAAELGGDSAGLEASAATTIEAYRAVGSLLEEERVEEAGALFTTDARDEFEELRDVSVSIRDSAAASVSEADGVVGSVLTVTSFVLAFLLPAGAFFAYRLVTRRQMRIARNQLNARMRAERRIHEAKDVFIANLSHELRTPLTSIYGFSEVLLEQGMIDPDTAQELIGLINTESADLSRMVDDLLVSARIDAEALSYDLQEVDLVHELETVMRPFQSAGLRIVEDCGSATVLADPLRLRQILRNLISNAVKHGGPTINIATRVKGDQMVCLIADDGPGVPEEMERRLFSRFVHAGHTPLTVGSVGLGLAVARSLAAGMDCELNYSRAGKWTVFTVTVPLWASGAGDCEETSPAPDELLVTADGDAGALR